MNTFSENNAMRIINSHGYRIEGDTAFLNADLFLPLQSQQTQWALQLWACERPHQGGQVSGFKIAEAAVELPEGPDGEPRHVEAKAFARLPADRREYSMVLVVASAAGGTEQVHDFANYTARETFVAPHLDGAVSYAIEAGQVALKAERVYNPRPGDNLSGTLSLELRAMPEPYRGDDTEGTVLASALLGQIAGQGSLQQFASKVPFSAPPDGLWHMVLLLREWTAKAGYVTRDFCAFSVLFEMQAPATEAAALAPELATEAVAVAPEPATEAVAVEPELATEAAAIAPEPATEAAAVAPEPEPAPAAPAQEMVAPSPTHTAPKSRGISIQTATVDELAKVNGLTRKVALEIVKRRPFTSLEDLLQVRGIGEKSLRKLRALLTL